MGGGRLETVHKLSGSHPSNAVVTYVRHSIRVCMCRVTSHREVVYHRVSSAQEMLVYLLGIVCLAFSDIQVCMYEAT